MVYIFKAKESLARNGAILMAFFFPHLHNACALMVVACILQLKSRGNKSADEQRDFKRNARRLSCALDTGYSAPVNQSGFRGALHQFMSCAYILCKRFKRMC